MWKFAPILKPTLWGGDRIIPFKGLNARLSNIGESWEISGVPGAESVVEEGPDHGLTLTQLIERHGDKLMGKRNFSRFGHNFPLLVKIIDAKTDLSVQVHPDDELARRRGYPNGKSEVWYVLNQKGGSIAAGFKSAVDPAELDSLLADGSIEGRLNKIDVRKGDVYYIPAGRVHSLGSGAMVLEVQQTSDITYRLYDFNRVDKDGRERELHVDLAREAIDFDDTDVHAEKFLLRMEVPTTVLRTPQFTLNLLVTESEFIRDYSESDTFVVIFCAEGEADITCGEETMLLRRGNTLLIPASACGITIKARRKATLLETYVS